MPTINYDPIIPANFSPLLKSNQELGTHRIVVRGGRNSGKTTTLIEEALDEWTTTKGAQIVLAREDDCDFRKTTFASAKKALFKFGIDRYCYIPKRTSDIIFKPNGNKIFFQAIGGDEHRTKGFELEDGYIHRYIVDEAQEIEEESHIKGAEKTMLRFMGKTTKFIYSYNPPPLRNALANVYFPKLIREGRAVEIYSSWKDIYTLLDPEIIEEILRDRKSDYNYYLYEYMGQVVNLSGMVFRKFNRKKHIVTVDRNRIAQEIAEIIIAVDGAIKLDATAVGLLAVLRNGNLLLLDAYYHDPLLGGELDNLDQSLEIGKWLNRCMIKYPGIMQKKYTGVVDNANYDLLCMLQRQSATGIMPWYPAKDKNIIRDCARLKNLIGSDTLLFHMAQDNDVHCIIEEIENYVYDDKTGDIKKNQIDHGIDMLKYGSFYYTNPEIFIGG